MNPYPRCLAVVLGVATGVFGGGTAWADDNLFAIQSRLSTPNFQLFLDFGESATVTNPNAPLFSIAGGVYGLSFVENTLFGVELENGTFVDYLITVPVEGAALGSRIGTVPIGFPSVESLATVDGQLYGASVDFAAHRTSLITIDSGSGAGTKVGEGSVDVIVVGMAYDRRNDVLYGAAIPFAGLDGNNLVTIDPTTGATTIVGDMQAPIQSLAWTPDGLFGAFDRVYHIDTTTAEVTAVGSTDFTDGKGVGPELYNGIYAMAALPVELPDEPTVGDTDLAITSIVKSGGDTVTLRWRSDANAVYDIQGSQTLTSGDWQILEADIPGQAEETTRTLSGLGEGAYYLRVAEQ